MTSTSDAFSIVPLYMNTTYAVKKEQGVRREAIDPIIRLFDDHLGSGAQPKLDEQGRIRLDDRELDANIQALIRDRWPRLEAAYLYTLTDWAACRLAFPQLFGFDVSGVDYDQPVEADVPLAKSALPVEPRP